MRPVLARVWLSLAVPLMAVAAGPSGGDAAQGSGGEPEAPRPGEYSPGGTCTGSSGTYKVEPRGRDILGAATCRNAVERALEPLVCPSKKPVAFEFAYKNATGSGRIYCP